MANFNAGVAALANAAASGVNSDITALTALSVPITPLQGGTASYWGGTSTGTNTIVAASLAPSGFTLTAGRRVTFLAGFTNTDATTLNANSTGAKNVFRMTPSGAQACTGGEIVAGTLVDVVYDGTQFQLVDVVAQFGGAGPVTPLASSATTNLGTISSHLVNITGVTTISSFGSSASTTYPFYWIGFQSALTLTYNATSMILPGAADIITAAGDSALAAYAGLGNWQILFYQRAASAPYRRKAPTYQDLTSGSSATYTAPTPRPSYLKVRAVAGGGGGGGSGNGGVGGTTTFNGISAVGGNGGVAHSGTTYGPGGLGGTGGSGAAQLRVNGSDGQGGQQAVNTSGDGPGGAGGGSAFFGGGGGNVGALGTAGATNTGGGGAGLASVSTSQGSDGGGGGGESFELIIDNPAATYTYTVGAAGTAGTGGVAGAAGRIVVEEFYN
jgi:hypothetical protein